MCTLHKNVRLHFYNLRENFSNSNFNKFERKYVRDLPESTCYNGRKKRGRNAPFKITKWRKNQ